jgi:nucleoside-diphosphate-sugar epimerase
MTPEPMALSGAVAIEAPPTNARGGLRMQVVLTGGGGFIGSYLLARMVGAGIQVTLIGPDTGKSSYTAALVAAGSVRFVQCEASFRQDDVLRAAVEDADALVLLGYVMPASRESSERLREEYASNVEPLTRLLRISGQRFRHVVFASSTAVYGAPARVPVCESDALSPLTPYGVAKTACEQVVTEFCASGGTATILRYSTVYGPGEVVPRAIPNFIRSALAGELPSIRGDGLDEHDYVHVTDVAEATLAAIRRPATGVYNIGTGIGTTTIDLARLVYRLAAAKVAPAAFGLANGSDARQTRIICDVAAARVGLGFSSRRSLEGGICEEIGWFRSGLAAASRSVTKRVA